MSTAPIKAESPSATVMQAKVALPTQRTPPGSSFLANVLADPGNSVWANTLRSNKRESLGESKARNSESKRLKEKYKQHPAISGQSAFILGQIEHLQEQYVEQALRDNIDRPYADHLSIGEDGQYMILTAQSGNPALIPS
ncbi:unnamed protein product [Diplocarpon coronariae]